MSQVTIPPAGAVNLSTINGSLSEKYISAYNEAIENWANGMVDESCIAGSVGRDQFLEHYNAFYVNVFYVLSTYGTGQTEKYFKFDEDVIIDSMSIRPNYYTGDAVDLDVILKVSSQLSDIEKMTYDRTIPDCGYYVPVRKVIPAGTFVKVSISASGTTFYAVTGTVKFLLNHTSR